MNIILVWESMGVLLAVYCHVYTRTCPAFEPAPLLLGAPIANVFPSDERHYFEPLTLYYKYFYRQWIEKEVAWM